VRRYAWRERLAAPIRRAKGCIPGSGCAATSTPAPAPARQRQQRTRQSPDRLAGALRLRRVGGYATATTDNTARTGARSMSHAISAALSSDVASTGRDSAQSARKVMTVVSTFTPAF
jgi:hypothetical protein